MNSHLSKFLLWAVGIVSTFPVVTAQSLPDYLDETKPMDVRVEDALQRMTLEEKIAMIHAQSKFCSPGVQRLGIPELWMTDGPHGIRPEVLWDEWDQAGWTNDSCVAFPALTCLAATWNPAMAHLYGKSLGEEARYRRKSVILGPGVNIYRTPLNGRNFEYMGEDPYLASRMVVPYVQGVQEQGVAACVKHYALNNNEVNRHTTNVIVDDRTLYEIYLPAFKAAVQQGRAWSIMGSYNYYKDQHCCHNQYLLNDILRREWGFDGAVISDWGGTHDTDEAIHNGLDLEFGSWTNGLYAGASNAYDSYYLAKPYSDLIKQGKVGTDELDAKVRNVLRLCFRTELNRQRPLGSLCSEAHYQAAWEVATEGIVLLKNDVVRSGKSSKQKASAILPLDLTSVRRIAVVGENAIKMMTVGGGSSSLKAQHEISPLDGLRHRLGNAVEVVYARGYVGDATGEYNGVVTGQNLADSRTPAELQAEAIELARTADVVLFVGGLNKSAGQDCEDSDRSSLELPYQQNELIAALAKANPHLVVVNISGNAVTMPWIQSVPAVVQAWYLGSECGRALASVLTGDVNPSGKLPMTFPASLDQVGAHALNTYPGVTRTDGSGVVDETYAEGIFVGYRWVDRLKKQRPLFAFGHGLSYTTFTYGKPSVDRSMLGASDSIVVTLPVTNTGSRKGAEIVQLYIRDVMSSVERPVKELKGFCKLDLEPGQTGEARFVVKPEHLAYFNAEHHEWVVEPGAFELLIGPASDHILQRVSISYQ